MCVNKGTQYARGDEQEAPVEMSLDAYSNVETHLNVIESGHESQ